MYDNRPVGIFDSGVGGLTIFSEITKLLPRESIIYLADQNNIPYSGKSKKELEKITSNVVRFLLATVAKKTKIGRIGILSTVATAESDYQKELIKKFTNGLKVFNVGTDKIVPFIEGGEVYSSKLTATLKDVLKYFASIDVLAL